MRHNLVEREIRKIVLIVISYRAAGFAAGNVHSALLAE
jgi:hypothetical protein